MALERHVQAPVTLADIPTREISNRVFFQVPVF